MGIYFLFLWQYQNLYFLNRSIFSQDSRGYGFLEQGSSICYRTSTNVLRWQKTREDHTSPTSLFKIAVIYSWKQSFYYISTSQKISCSSTTIFEIDIAMIGFRDTFGQWHLGLYLVFLPLRIHTKDEARWNIRNSMRSVTILFYLSIVNQGITCKQE